MFINNTSSGKKFQVDVSGSDTVGTLKSQISDELGVPAKYQHICCNGVVLSNNKATLSDYKVLTNGEVELHLTLNGGAGGGCHICNCFSAGCHCTIV